MQESAAVTDTIEDFYRHCRASLVLALESRRWKVVQLHVSVEVPDEQVVALQKSWAAGGQGE